MEVVENEDDEEVEEEAAEENTEHKGQLVSPIFTLYSVLAF